MVMIVVHHCIVHGMGLVSGLGTSDASLIAIPDAQMPVAFILNCLCICAVNCFVLISGYFGIRTNKNKFLSLLGKTFFYTIIFGTIPYLIAGRLGFIDGTTGLIDAYYGKALRSLLFLSHSSYWFIIDYLFLMVFAPVLNAAFEKLDIRHLRHILTGLLIINCYFGFIHGNIVNTGGYTLMQFILMYCIGRYIAKENLTCKSRTDILLYLSASLSCAALMLAFWYCGNWPLAWKMTNYNNPLLVVSAIALFMLFKNLNFKSAFINRISSSALAIYLIQSSPVAGKVQYGWISGHAAQIGGGIWLIIILLSILIVAASIIFDQILSRVTGFISKRDSEK